MEKKTQKQFEQILNLVQPNIKLIGNYVNMDTKVLVKDDLGIKYLSTPFKLLQNKVPSILSATDKNEAFKILSINVHGLKYNYEKSIYINSNTKLTITCQKHGDFIIAPAKHLCGQGCKKCGDIVRGLKKRESTQSFIKKAIKVHGNLYDYSQVNYITAIEKIIIICPIHGEFRQQPNNHLSGQGCPICKNDKISKAAKKNSYGWSFSNWNKKVKNNNNTKPRLYLLECNFNNEKFIKVGMTMHTVKKRYPGKSQMPYNFTILKEVIDTPIKIFNLEQKVKKEFKKYKFLPMLNFNGMYECYNKKIKNKMLDFINNNC